MNIIKADEHVKNALISYCEDLEKHMAGDVFILRGPIYLRLDDFVRIEIERLVAAKNKKDKADSNAIRAKLIVVLETTGGFVEVVERISNVFRRHYQEVEFVVPNFAYSAGTVLVLSGDRIHMDYYSVLGPIDPQTENGEGKLVPGMGYLFKFQEMIGRKKLNDAEMLYLVKRFDPAELFVIEQASNHSIELIRTWLPQYKFKNWKRTIGRKKRVTMEMKKRRAGQIATILGNPERWHSHGRGIGIRDLTGDEIKLLIDDFGKDANLNLKIRQYYDLFMDFCEKIQTRGAIHTCLGFRQLSWGQP